MATSLTAEQIEKLNQRFGPGRAYREGLGDLINDALSTSAGDITLADGSILIGNGSNVAVANAMSGDVTISNTGVAAIGSGVVVNADVNASAAIAFSKLAALTSANILVGNGSNVATAVAVTGDISIDNAGLTAIASGVIVNADVNGSAAIAYSKLALSNSIVAGDITTGAVTAAKLSDTNSAVKMQKISVGFAALNTATSGVAALFGTAIPDNAIVKHVYYEITQSFSGDGDSGSAIKMGIEDQDDDLEASAVLSSWNAGFKEGVPDDEVANFVKLSAARQLAVTWTAGGTDTALDAGAMDVFIEYVQGS